MLLPYSLTTLSELTLVCVATEHRNAQPGRPRWYKIQEYLTKDALLWKLTLEVLRRTNLDRGYPRAMILLSFSPRPKNGPHSSLA